jgi:hypothetical protein
MVDENENLETVTEPVKAEPVKAEPVKAEPVKAAPVAPKDNGEWKELGFKSLMRYRSFQNKINQIQQMNS